MQKTMSSDPSQVNQGGAEQARYSATNFEQMRLEVAFQEASIPMAFRRGPDHIFEKVNQQYQNLHPGCELIGKTTHEAIPEHVDKKLLMHLDAVFKTGVPYSAKASCFRLRRSLESPIEERFFDFVYQRINGPEGEPYGIFSHAVEVTDYVLAMQRFEKSEQLLRRNKTRLTSAISVSKVGFFEWNIRSNEIKLSEQMRSDWGLKGTGKIEASRLGEIIFSEDRERVVELVNRAIETHSPYFAEYRILKPGGTVSWIESQGKAIYDQNGAPVRFLATSLNVTEKKNAQIALEEAKAQAEAANKAKSLFLAQMSHEIRSPLTAIIGFCDLLRAPQLADEDKLYYLSVINRNSEHLTRVIDDVLDLAKVEAGKIALEKVSFSLVEFLFEFSSSMKLKAHSKGVHFEIKALGLIPEFIETDPTRLRQILSNTVGNAIKFCDQGSVVLEVGVVEKTFTYKVQDSGRGISPKQQSRLFKEFSQADDSTSRKYGGTGLGLILTKRLSQALGGDFYLVASELGVGSIFAGSIAVEVPPDVPKCAFEFAGRGAVTSAGFPDEDAPLGKLEILLVDDSNDNQVFLTKLFGGSGARITLASDGREGVTKGLNGHYDVILMDIQMPRMDGFEAVHELRENGYTGPIVALTACAMKEERLSALQSGFSHFLSKPIDRKNLFKFLAQFRN